MAFIVVYDASMDGRTVAACIQQIADSRTRPPKAQRTCSANSNVTASSNLTVPWVRDSRLMLALMARTL